MSINKNICLNNQLLLATLKMRVCHNANFDQIVNNCNNAKYAIIVFFFSQHFWFGIFEWETLSIPEGCNLFSVTHLDVEE